jgi:hypothetical protein
MQSTILTSDIMRSELQHLVKNWSFDVPFERSVRAHYLTLQRLANSGLTWATIADAMTQAGARHKNGRPISARQINSVFLRVRKAQSTNSANAASLGLTPYVRVSGDVEIERLSRPTQAKSDDKDAAISPEAVAIPAPRPLTELTQRLTEARRLSEATGTEYDD